MPSFPLAMSGSVASPTRKDPDTDSSNLTLYTSGYLYLYCCLPSLESPSTHQES